MQKTKPNFQRTSLNTKLARDYKVETGPQLVTQFSSIIRSHLSIHTTLLNISHTLLVHLYNDEWSSSKCYNNSNSNYNNNNNT